MASPPVSNAAHSDDWRKTVAPSGMCKACQSTKVTTRCRLLSLPPELRRCIWEMVLDGESCDIEPNYEDQPVFAELMDVCMQIRQEAMVFVLRSTRLRIEVYVHGTAKRQFERFLNSLNVECRRALSANTDAKLVLYIGNCEPRDLCTFRTWPTRDIQVTVLDGLRLSHRRPTPGRICGAEDTCNKAIEALSRLHTGCTSGSKAMANPNYGERTRETEPWVICDAREVCIRTCVLQASWSFFWFCRRCRLSVNSQSRSLLILVRVIYAYTVCLVPAGTYRGSDTGLGFDS
ncbi:hypothetical protein M8818_001829 [Zalaria obscura]|uniref:Uncharacterized protein n=1 Tax=Zalaria obscura TaxID=2024903 RepID=A0ACC3SJG2_9PEZI